MSQQRSIRRFGLQTFGLLALLICALPAVARSGEKLLGIGGGCGLGSVTISGNTVHAGISLPGILGTELVLQFENAQNLTASNLGICARLLTLTELLTINARLPDEGLGGLLQLPLPLIITVEPPQTGTLSFTNTYRAEIHTDLLGFTIDSPYRLYKSPHGGTFYDITSEVAQGSVRTRGNTGGFSDFIVVLDLVPSVDHASDKYDYLAARIQNAALGPKLHAQLASDLAASRTAFDAANYTSALSFLDSFEARVRLKAGAGIPNVWRAQRDLDNVAGDLIGYSDSLRFSILRVQSGT